MGTSDQNDGAGRTRRDEAEAVRALNDAWNAHTNFSVGADAKLDSELLAAIDEITLLAGPPKRPQRVFTTRLENELMNATNVRLARATSGMGMPRLDRRAALGHGRDRPRRWATALALTFAVIVLAVSLIGPTRFGPGQRPPTSVPAIALAPSSPGADQTGSPTARPTQQPIVGDQDTVNNRLLGVSGINASFFGPALGDAPYETTLTKWSLAPGQTVDFSSALVGTTQGVAVDLVLTGTARATFDQAFVVYRGPRVLAGAVIYGKAGEAVELERGDTVVYRYDQPRSVTNALKQNDLQVLTFILTAGDATPTIPRTATFAATVLGKGSSPISPQAQGGLFIQFFVWSTTTPDAVPRLGASHATYAISGVPIDPNYSCCYFYNVVVSGELGRG